MENQSPTIGKLVLALSKAQGKFEGAAKSSDNPFFKSKYADLHECIEAAKKPLAENELAVIQTTDTDEKGIWVITTLGHSSGEWIRGKILMKPKKDDDQGTGSSITYGRRYTFAAIVGLAQKDDDGNASVSPENGQKVPDKEKGKQPQTGQADKKASQAKPEADRKIIEPWLEWIDKFTNSTLDAFLVQWYEHGEAAVKAMPEHLGKELLLAKGEMEKFLMENVAK